jgi:hypothetical protein
MGLALGFVHCFNWPRRLPRLAAYSLGTGIIWAGVFLYKPWLELLWFPLVAGVVTFGLWELDKLSRRIADVYLVWKRGRRDQRSDTTDSMDV